MTATFKVKEVFAGRKASGTRKDHTYTRRFFVEASESATPFEVAAAPGIPIFGSAYPQDPFAFVKSVSADARSEHPLFFDVDVEYSNTLDVAPGQGINPANQNSPSKGTGDPLAQQDSPLLRPWIVRWGTAAVTKSVLEDRNGAAIKNAAGAPYEAGLEVETGHLTLTVVRNELAALFDPVIMNEYVFKTNLLQWNGFETDRVLLTSIETGDRAYDRGVFYFPVTYQFKIAPAFKTHARRVLNAGWYYLTAANDFTKKKVFTDDTTGRQLSTPGLLKADGTKLEPFLDAPVYLNFDVYGQIDYKELKMG